MSGHSHWAGIKHRKEAQDTKRGKIYTKIMREIIVAVKSGGANPESNSRLRKALDNAKDANMPKDNIEKAIAKGLGQIPGAEIEEITFEGYGPGGIAILLEATTDNKNRTTSEIRKIFSSHGGSLGEVGCVSWIFKSKGYITIPKNTVQDEDKLMELALEYGAEDFRTDEDEFYEIITPVENFEEILKKIIEEKNQPQTKEITILPNSYVKLTGKQAQQALSLLESLENYDDVKNVYSNLEIPSELVAATK